MRLKEFILFTCLLYLSIPAKAIPVLKFEPGLFPLMRAGKDSALQKPRISSWYSSAGLFHVVKAKPGGCLAATVILANNWGLSYSFKNAEYAAKNLPATYSGGLDLFGINSAPHDYLEFNSLMLVRQFKLKNSGIKLGLQGGPAWVRSIVRDFEPVPPRPAAWFDYGPTHEISNSYKENIGLSLRTSMAITLARVVSVELALFGNVNNIKSVAGVEVCVNLGKIRNKKM